MNARFLAAMCAAVLPCFVQPLAADQECNIRGVSLQPEGPGDEVHAHDASGETTAGVIKVKSFLNHEFDKLTLKSPKIVFTAKPDPASAKDPAEMIGSCEIPANANSVIVVFIAETPGKPACRVLVVDDSAKSFPPGSIKVANLTSVPIKIELEKKPFDFNPGETKLIEDMPVGPNNTAGMKGTFERDGKWNLFSSGMWPHPGDKRVLQVLTENPATKRIQIRGMRDVAKP